MQIIPLNDTNADPSFRLDELMAIILYHTTFSSTNVTVTIQFGNGNIAGTPLDPNDSQGNINSVGVQYLPYVTLRNYLLEFGNKGFFNKTNLPPTLTNLPPTFQGNPPNFWVSSAVAKIFGMPVNVGVDGFVGIGTGFTPGPERIAAFVHEIGHALGRVPENFMGNGDQSYETFYSQLDLWRFTRPQTRLFDGSTTTAPFAYFSLDGGVTRRRNGASYRIRAIFEAQIRFHPLSLRPMTRSMRFI
jgi:hypothetical protein